MPGNPPRGRYFGLDIHEKTVYVTVIAPWEGTDGSIAQYELPLTEKSLNELLSQLTSEDSVAFEGTRNSWHLYRRIDPRVGKVVVANSKKLQRRLPKDRTKTDRNDSFDIAMQLLLGCLPAVWMPDEPTRQDRDLLRLRYDLVKDQTRYKNRIRAILSQHGLDMPGSTFRNEVNSFLKKLRVSLPIGDRERLVSNLELLKAVEAKIERTELLIEERAAEREDVALLRTIQGVDTLLAMTILAYIGPIERFHSPRSLANYSGLVPKVYSSGGKCKKGGRITKAGPRPLRWALTMAVQQLRKRKGKYRNLYRRLSRKKGEGLAVAACARKLLEAIWHMLTSRQAFEEGDPQLTERKQKRHQRRLEKARRQAASEQSRREALESRAALLLELSCRGTRQLPLPKGLHPSFGRWPISKPDTPIQKRPA